MLSDGSEPPAHIVDAKVGARHGCSSSGPSIHTISPILALPLEIRLMIYRLSIVAGGLAILIACKLIQKEVARRQELSYARSPAIKLTFFE
ncbi:hypothetical protein HO173_005448 [Letharia columbiana]|uniref:Uncharacterized protein n=1 Tax=Letharia columbiana TaxID=112416 RepID=A0A8H6FWZ4_9LECA|nr:uncharacterized protein HO173_005448 [Letharia columbiana]KAF6236357.1 hypothetical protein HO173_005448 [Letharia columbiana]